MDAQLKAKWVEALRSGEYRQGRGCLRQGDKFCCLGVLAQISGLEFEKAEHANAILVDGQYSGYHPLYDLLGDNRKDASDLWYRNDGQYGHNEHSFSEIADYIEKNL